VKIQSLKSPATLLFILVLLSCINAKSTGFKKPTASNQNKEKEKATSGKKEKKKFSATIKNVSPYPTKAIKEMEISIPGPDTALISVFAKKLKTFAVENKYSTKYCFLLDVSIPGGRNRFFVYDLEKNTIIYSALVAHESCSETSRSGLKSSSGATTGCRSLGKYKVGEFYQGIYGKSYRLYGLDDNNSGAYKKGVVIHSYGCVPDKEIYPMTICNSLGSPMVSYQFFQKLSAIIGKSERPVLLWIYG